MKFFISAISDAGIKKPINQDSIFAEHYQTEIGEVTFAVVCDGMGGLQYGEVASAALISALSNWAHTSLPTLCTHPVIDHDIRTAWTNIVSTVNREIMQMGDQGGFKIGTTVAALLLTEERYFIMNIGDSRVYEIGEEVHQLTTDHTVIEDEIRLGNMTREQAETAPMKSVLTRCVGIEPTVYPDLYFGEPVKNTVYMLCSDGFRHHISTEEMRQYLLPLDCENAAERKLQEGTKSLVELNKSRGETDNISAISILVY